MQISEKIHLCFQLDVAESAEERKALRTELRELRKKGGGGRLSLSQRVQQKNLINEELNKVPDLNNNLVPDLNNNLAADSDDMDGGLRVKPAEERAARRARRAAHMNQIASEKDVNQNVTNSFSKISISSSTTNGDTTTNKFETKNFSTTNKQFGVNKPTRREFGSSSEPLKRSGTWHGNRPGGSSSGRPSFGEQKKEEHNIGDALSSIRSQFKTQVSTSFTFKFYEGLLFRFCIMP